MELPLFPWKLPRFHGSLNSFHESFHESDENFRGSRGSFHGSFHELPHTMQIVQVARIFYDVLPCSKTPPFFFRASRDYFNALRKCPYGV